MSKSIVRLTLQPTSRRAGSVAQERHPCSRTHTVFRSNTCQAWPSLATPIRITNCGPCHSTRARGLSQTGVCLQRVCLVLFFLPISFLIHDQSCARVARAGSEDGIFATPVRFQPTATVSQLTTGAVYALLRFDSPAAVPVSSFLSGAYAQRVDFTATSTIHVLRAGELEPIWSNGTYFYRCVAV